MQIVANKQTCSAGENAFEFTRACGEINLMIMQKIAELQFTFLSTQMEGLYEQFKFLCNDRISGHLSSAASGLASATGNVMVDKTRKTTPVLAASGKIPVPKMAKRVTTVTMPKIKSGDRRKTGKKNS